MRAFALFLRPRQSFPIQNLLCCCGFGTNLSKHIATIVYDVEVHVGKTAQKKKKKPEKDSEPPMQSSLFFPQIAMYTRRLGRAHVGRIAGAIQLKHRIATERGTPRDVGWCDHEDRRVHEWCELRLRETEKLSHFVRDTQLHRSQFSLRL